MPSSSPSSSAEQSPAVPMLHLGQFETGGGWGLGDQFARLPPAEEQQKSHGNIYKVAPPTDRDRAGEAGLGARHDAGGHSSVAVVPETTYLTGSEEDDDTFVDHGSVAHAAPLGSPPQTSGGTTRPPKFATQRPPVIKAAPPNTRLSHSLGGGGVMGATGDAYAPLPHHAVASGSTDMLVSSSGTAPFPSATAGRLSLSPQSSSMPSPNESRLGFMRSRPAGSDASGAAGQAGRQHDNSPSRGVLVAKAPADRWDPPRLVSRMTLPSAVRDLAVDPSGDRLWLAAGDAPLTVAELHDTKLQTSKSITSITQVYCMAVVEVPSGGQSVTFKSVDEKRSKKKRSSSSAYEDANGTVAKNNRYELWCGLSRGHIAVVDLESGTDAGLIAQAHSQPVHRMWSLSNGKVWSAGRDKAVHIWNPQSRRALKTRNIAAILSHLIYIPHTRQVWATADDNIIRVYEGGGSNASLQRPGHDKNDNMVRMRSDILTLAYHEDANVVWVCMNRTTALVHPRSGEVECLLPGSVSAVAFHEKTAIAAAQGAFFQSETMRLVVLDVTDAMRPTIMFLGSTVETVNCIGLHLFHPTPLAVIAHDEGKQGNKKHRLTVFTYAETAPLVDYSSRGEGDANRTPEQRQEAVGYRNVSPSRGPDLSLRGSTAVSPGPFAALTSPPSSLAASGARLPSNTTPTPVSHAALSQQSSTNFAGMPHVVASASGPAAAAVAAAAAGPRHVNHTTTKMLSLVTTNTDAISAPRSPGHAANVAELGNSTAVVEPAVPQRPVYRDNNPEAGIIPGPARNAEVVASLSKLEKRTEEVCGMLASTRRTEPPLADLAKLHSEASAWLISSDIPATLPGVPREETERIEKAFRTPEGRVLATIMARLRLAAAQAHLKDTTDAGEGGQHSPADPNRSASPLKQKSPQSPASSLSGNPASGRSPPAVHLMGGGSGVQTSRDFFSSGSVLPVAADSKYQTSDSITGGVAAGSGGDMAAQGALAALAGSSANMNNGVAVLPDGGAPALSSEAVLQWVAQLSRTAQEERRLHERQLHSLQRHNKRIAERNASLVNGMTKVCESVRNWGQRVADEADAQWARLTPQANSMEADHHRLAISIIRRAVTELDDVLTTSGPREIRNYVTRIQSCLTRIVALQEKSQQFFLSATLEARLLSSTTGSAPAQQGAGTNDKATEKTDEPLVTASAATPGPSTSSRSPWPTHDDQAGGQARAMAPGQAPSADHRTPASPSDTPDDAVHHPLAHPTSSATTGVSAIIEAGLAPPLAVPQLVSSITSVADTMLKKAKRLTDRWSCLSEMQRELYAPYTEAAAAATTTRVSGAGSTEVALTPVPALDLATDFATFPVLWDLSAAYSMFELCVRESHALVLDSLLSSDGVVQCVPVREEDKSDVGADDEDRFIEATLGTAEFTQRLVEDMRANMNRTDGLTPALQKRMLIGGLLEDYPSEAVQRETLAAAAATSRKLGDLSEGIDKQGTRMRRDLHSTLETLHHTIARLQTPADLEDTDSVIGPHVGEAPRGELPSSLPMAAPGRAESAPRTVRHPSFSSSSSLHTTSTWMHSTRPIAIFGGFLGMEQKPLVYAGRLRGGVYWAHVYLCFLEQCVEAAANVLQTGDTVMPEDNFLAMTEMIVEWRGNVEALAGVCLTVRNTLSTTRSDMEDVVAALPPRIAQLATANGSRLTRRYPGSDTAYPGQPKQDSTGITPNVDSWMRTMRSGTRRTQGDPLLGYTGHVTNTSGGGGGGVIGGIGSGPPLGVSSSDLVGPLTETVRNSFDLNFLSVCLRLYLHQTCTPSPSALRDARSLADLHGCTVVPPIMQSIPVGASSSQTGVEEALDYLGRADGAGILPHTSDLVESPRGRTASGDGAADAAAEKGRDAFDATRTGLEEIIASIDAILLTAQRLHATCRRLDAHVAAIVEANAKWEAAAEENSGSASSTTPPVVVLATDPVVVAQLRGGTTALGTSHDGAGGDGGAKNNGSGTAGEPSPHRAPRHHHRKPSSSSVRGGNSSGSAKGDAKDSPGTVPADKTDL